MRDWFDELEQEVIREALGDEFVTEGKFGTVAAAAALAATAGYMAKNNQATAAPIEMSDISTLPPGENDVEIVYTDADRNLDELNPREEKAKEEAKKKKPAAKEKKPEKEKKKRKLADDRVSEPVRLLAKTIWGEARSDGPAAMRAVGHVIMNRIASPRKFGRNVKEVVLKRKAFSCWNPSDPNRKKIERVASLPDDHPSKKRYQQALLIAQEILSGKSKDPTGGALFYHTKSISPYWADPSAVTRNISSHVFYDDDKKS